MAFKVAEKKIHFHKCSMDRIPKRYLPVFSGVDDFSGIDVSLTVKRNLAGTKYYWIFVFLSRTFVFWSESFDNIFMSEFSHVIYAYVASFVDEVNKNPRVCNVLTQKFSVSTQTI